MKSMMLLLYTRNLSLHLWWAEKILRKHKISNFEAHQLQLQKTTLDTVPARLQYTQA